MVYIMLSPSHFHGWTLVEGSFIVYCASISAIEGKESQGFTDIFEDSCGSDC